MKKTLAVLLVCVLVMASAFAFSFRSLGIETGGGYYVSGDMDIIDNLDIYVRLGYSGQFNLSFGGQYKVADFKIDSTIFDLGGSLFGKHTTEETHLPISHLSLRQVSLICSDRISK